MKSGPPVKRVVCPTPVRGCYRPAPKDAGFHFVQATLPLPLSLDPEGSSYCWPPLKGSSYSFTLNLSCIISSFSWSWIYFLMVASLSHHRADIVSFRPKVSVPKLVFQVCVLVKDHECAFSFEVSHETRHAHLWGNAYQHMDMIRHHMSFDNLYTFVSAELLQDLHNAFFVLIIDYLSSILRCKYNMILSHPFCAS